MKRFSKTRQLKDLPKINLNKATLEELVRLPGIGTVTANRIIEYRQRHGPFRNIEDLVFKVGVHQRIFDKLSDRLVV